MADRIHCLSSIILVFLYIHNGSCRDAPVFNSFYSVSGNLYLPYADLSEPFDAWYDVHHKRSRIDYYGGMVKTYQLGDDGHFGSSVQIVPVTTESYTNVATCFKSDGSLDSPVTPQAILPDLTNFKFVGTEVKNGYQCEKWREIDENFGRTSTYTIWIRWNKNARSPSLNQPVPVRYEMKGYNSLIGSHYDHYYLNYHNFITEEPTPEIFKVSSNISCDGHTELNDLHVYNTNPMKELINRHKTDSNRAWDNYKLHHAKSYPNDEQYDHRKDIFNHNLRYIHSTNRRGLSYILKVNHLSDRTDEELKLLRGGKHSSHSYKGNSFPYTVEELRNLTKSIPLDFDWRIQGAVSPVKDQATCGSCWSFASVGAVEGAYFLKTGRLVRFSEQALVDCTWGYGNNGCNGGNDDSAYSWMMKHGGIPTDEEYGSYLGQDGYCHVDMVNKKCVITGFVDVTANDENALRVALFNHGPVSVFMDASHKSFSFYSNGIYYEPQCKSGEEDLDHVVLVVGYGTLNGQNYWLVKNSWSNHWGNQGYVLMSTQGNNCGIMTLPSYVTM